MLLFLAIAAYVGSKVSEPYFRYYQFRDDVKQEARFASLRPDSAIKRNIWANADSLLLPEGAYHVRINRTRRSVRIRTDYDDSWTLWKYTRPVHFDIDIESSL